MPENSNVIGRIIKLTQELCNTQNSSVQTIRSELSLLNDLLLEVNPKDLDEKDAERFRLLRISIREKCSSSTLVIKDINTTCDTLGRILSPYENYNREITMESTESLNADVVGKWWKLEIIGGGGQGEVWKVMRLNDELHELIKCIQVSPIVNRKNVGAHSTAVARMFKLFANTISEGEAAFGALKIIKTDGKDPERAPARMRNEIQVLQSLKHPSIVPIYDVDQNFLWYVSRYFPRGSLANSRNISLYRGDAFGAIIDFMKLVDAVKCIHEHEYEYEFDGRKETRRDMCHRDIKLANILVDVDAVGPHLYLGDFGIVKVFNENEQLTLTGDNPGSRHWMAPWLKDKSFDSNSVRDIEELRKGDLYTLGKVLWAMIAGEKSNDHDELDPFHFDDHLLKSRFDTPSMTWIDDMLRKCVVSNPQQCIPSCDDLLKECELVQNKIASEWSKKNKQYGDKS